MPEDIPLTVNGRPTKVAAGTTVAVAVLLAGETMFRSSVTGRPRGPLCGMGICYECRVTVDDMAHCRSCQMVCVPGMTVKTG